MCGIFSIVTRDEQKLGPYLIEAGQRLSYRGYDSVGCATIHDDGSVDLRKDVGKVDEVARKLGFAEMSGRRGMVQLRWATFGSPSQRNAQPHLDSDGDLVGAHNGNVVNNVELRQQFISEGMTVRSTNDGESCVHAVERYVNAGSGMVDAICRAAAVLEGDYAFTIGRRGEDCLYALKSGSGLVVGLADGFTCVSSDLPSILPFTRRIIRVNDGEIVILRHDRAELRSAKDGSPIDRAPEEIQETMEAAQKGGYPHFMLKEIHEQPEVALELYHLLRASKHMAPMVQKMKAARNLYLVACGTSYHACVLGAVYLAQLAGRPAIPVIAPQFVAQYAPAVGLDDVGVFVSQSGETKDVLNAIESIRYKEMEVFSLVNVLGSTLMNVSERYLPLACGYEISVPATKTFVNQALAFLFLALKMGGHDTGQIAGLPQLIQRTIDDVEPQVAKLEPALAGHSDMYCLGYGLTYPIALEGALKLKEVTYAHCEGMLSTEFKHGPLSAVSQDYPVIFVAGPDDVPLMISGINETTCRGGRAIIVAEADARLASHAHEMITLPKAGPLMNPILAVVPLQLLAYKHSVARGFDPDFPRNLSKTLTVD